MSISKLPLAWTKEHDVFIVLMDVKGHSYDRIVHELKRHFAGRFAKEDITTATIRRRLGILDESDNEYFRRAGSMGYSWEAVVSRWPVDPEWAPEPPHVKEKGSIAIALEGKRYADAMWAKEEAEEVAARRQRRMDVLKKPSLIFSSVFRNRDREENGEGSSAGGALAGHLRRVTSTIGGLKKKPQDK
ncbi:MAG: hypothetical protein M1827_002130 [Pycnora praestabilis]|nr:MAG: hypothetical protein M1827_002130 [Pycnora praestabilis]